MQRRCYRKCLLRDFPWDQISFSEAKHQIKTLQLGMIGMFGATM